MQTLPGELRQSTAQALVGVSGQLLGHLEDVFIDIDGGSHFWFNTGTSRPWMSRCFDVVMMRAWPQHLALDLHPGFSAQPYPFGTMSGTFEQDSHDLLAEIITFRLVEELHGLSAALKKIEKMVTRETLVHSEHGQGRPTPVLILSPPFPTCGPRGSMAALLDDVMVMGGTGTGGLVHFGTLGYTWLRLLDFSVV